ncbi:hypothetical protein EI94DRAFT_1727607 [Lactarius quietus]|nr:hypothetical protein EI94DRAFT_1727607 [Lactarius quietus]
MPQPLGHIGHDSRSTCAVFRLLLYLLFSLTLFDCTWFCCASRIIFLFCCSHVSNILVRSRSNAMGGVHRKWHKRHSRRREVQAGVTPG